jgi:hypothetical protein
MTSGRARITINQIAEPHAKPRSAKFRDNYGVPNTEYLWPEWNEEARRAAGLKPGRPSSARAPRCMEPPPPNSGVGEKSTENLSS